MPSGLRGASRAGGEAGACVDESRRSRHIAATEQPRVNERIRIREVRLIDQDGKQIGILSTADALQMAKDAGLDLVEVAAQARPPVCKIMDYGKFKYEQRKRTQQSRKKMHQVKVKEVRLRPKIEKHDLEVKLRRARQFLEQGDKVLVNMLFRGREMQLMREHAPALMVRFAGMLEDIAKIERHPRVEGRRMNMLLTHRN
jgi:translation initiation factor IF-3